MIDVETTEIEGVFTLRPTVQRDSRGSFVKILHADIFLERGLPIIFSEQYYSTSKKNVLRGLHFQLPPHDHYKLVTCIEGEVLDAVVDLRKGSDTYGLNQTFELNGARGDSVFVPSGCAHGFYVRSASAIMFYNVSSAYEPSHDSGIRWDSAGIVWPSEQPILSDRDAAFMPFVEFKTPFKTQ
jgi:dTDP-4-dehydrorhamnose 3,5-epimerase